MITRHKQIVQTHNIDNATAALLVLAEQVQILVQAITNVNSVVSHIEAATPAVVATPQVGQSDPVPDQVEIVRHLSALPEVNVDLGQDGIEYIRQQYVR